MAPDPAPAPPPPGRDDARPDAWASTAGDGEALLGRTAVVVVSYGSAELLDRNLTEVARAVPEALVVVVENDPEPASTAPTAELCRRQGWVLEQPGTNTGFGGGMNLGVARARARSRDLLVLLNPDAVIARADLARLVARAAAEPTALVAPVLRSSRGTVVADRAVVCLADGSMRSPRSSRPVPPGGTRPWLSGACLALSTSLFEAAGGFDARYFLYWEDVDFSWRVLRAGGRLVPLSQACAVHDEGGTHNEAGARAKSLTYYYYNIRNRLLLAALWLEPAEQRRWVASSVGAAREVVLRGGRRQLLGSFAPVRTAVAATRDGLRLAREVRRGTLPGPEVPLPR